MSDQLEILAIIPARGGSKGVPSKNIKPLAGRPLLAWTIDEAKKSKYISELIVSSEDETIIKVAKNYGAKVPFVRPKELALDETPGIEPIKHAIRYYKDQNIMFDYVMCLQCTSPLRTVDDIDAAVEQCIRTEADSIMSVCESEHSPYWMMNIDDKGRLSPFLNDRGSFQRRQDIPKVYRLNGAIYLAKPETILKTNGWFGTRTQAFIMCPEHSIDIDTALDFSLAELVFVPR